MWLFLIEVGFTGFLVSLFCAIWRGFGPDGNARRPLGLWLLAAGIFFALWIVGLHRFPIPFAP